MSKRPDLLKSGDRVGIIAPSRVIFKEQMKEAIKTFSSWGLEIVQGKSLYQQDGYFAGTDEDRTSDFQAMISDKSIKAIFCARGGYGMTRFLDQLDFTPLIDQSKWIVGFSDITALHLKLNLLGIESIHGLMPVQFGYDGVVESIDSLYKLLFESHNSYNRQVDTRSIDGEVTSELVGGNLSLICDSLGTASEIDTNQKILFLEEIDEYLYKVDRMMTQLKRANKLKQLKGVIIGDFSKIRDTEIPFGKDLLSLLSYYFEELNIPVVFGFPAGHEPFHLALPLSRVVHLKVEKGSCQINF